MTAKRLPNTYGDSIGGVYLMIKGARGYIRMVFAGLIRLSKGGRYYWVYISAS